MITGTIRSGWSDEKKRAAERAGGRVTHDEVIE
jgi:hypothetical protein